MDKPEVEVGELVFLRKAPSDKGSSTQPDDGCGCDDCNFDYDACDAGDDPALEPESGQQGD